MTDDTNSNSSQESLYDKIGGTAGIENLVGAFYNKVFADPELHPFFHDVPVEKLKRMQRDLFSSALGGPVSYSGRPLAHAHHGLGIKPKHFQSFVGHLFSTLKTFDLTEEDRDEIISRINLMVDEIVGGGGLDA